MLYRIFSIFVYLLKLKKYKVIIMKKAGVGLLKYNKFGCIAFIALFIYACGVGKMVKKHEEVKYNVTPNPLEAHGGKIPVKIDVTYPEKYFNKKATVEVTPYLKHSGGEVTLETMTLIGENVEGEGKKVNMDGGTITYTDTVPYTPALRQCDLMIKAAARIGTKEAKELGDIKLAEGTVITSTRALNDEKILVGKDNYEKETILSKEATIYFPIQNATVRGSEKYNKSMKELRNFVKQGYEGKGVAISSYASPDGPLELNENLAEKREKNSLNYIEKELKKEGFKGATDETTYKKTTVSEDWSGFRKLLQESDIEDKEVMLKILDSYSDPVAREKEIKNLTSAYGKLRNNVLPKLRRTEITVNVLEPKLSDSIILVYALSNPDTLKQEELGFAPTLTENWDDKYAIYQSYVATYPDDWRGYNNLGYIHAMQGDYDAARTSFDKANSMSPDNAVVYNNMGSLYILQGDLDNAYEYHEKARVAGADNSYNMGAYSLKTADYPKAINYFGADACGYNQGLAHLLSDDYDNAAKSLRCSEVENADKYYLLAIIGARTADKTMVVDNMKKATEMNSAYKEDAKTDLEFRTYWGDSDFQAVVQ